MATCGTISVKRLTESGLMREAGSTAKLTRWRRSRIVFGGDLPAVPPGPMNGTAKREGDFSDKNPIWRMMSR